eukprot:TRINITY_DN26886_c0_g1_i1.p1 TRINITY_DN26886_c0_g1~~TRINITY_DN26886_c0_g1_i1.p1  ORF type:complete len:1031 (-),score=240.72 TRINITY_DN26886_c0_g1_i1:202-3294(-)
MAADAGGVSDGEESSGPDDSDEEEAAKPVKRRNSFQPVSNSTNTRGKENWDKVRRHSALLASKAAEPMPSQATRAISSRRQSDSALMERGQVARQRPTLTEEDDLRQTSKLTNDSAPSNEPPQEMAAAEWTTKIQSKTEVQEHRKQTGSTMLSIIEMFIPGLGDIRFAEKLKLRAKLENEVLKVQQTVARQAYGTMSDDLENYRQLKQEWAAVEDKMARMNRTYLQEVQQGREKGRNQPIAVKEELDKNIELREKLDRCGVDAVAEASKTITYYQPLTYFSEEVQKTTLLTVDELVKGLFDKDESLSAQTNVREMDRFQLALLQAKLDAAEKDKKKLLLELTEMQQRSKKLQLAHDKALWDLSRFHRGDRDLLANGPGINDDTASNSGSISARASSKFRKFRATGAGNAAAGCGGTGTTGSATDFCCKKHAEKYKSGGAASIASMSLHGSRLTIDDIGDMGEFCSECSDEATRLDEGVRPEHVDICVQVDDQDNETFLELEGTVLEHLQHLDTPTGLWKRLEEKNMSRQVSAELEQQLLEKTQMLEGLQADFEELAAKKKKSKEAAEAEAEDQQYVEGLRTADGRKVTVKELQQELEDARQEVLRATHEVTVQYELAKARKQELEVAKSQVAQAEARSVQILKAATEGTLEQELGIELNAERDAKRLMHEDVETLQAALSMALSRNRVMQAAQGNSVHDQIVRMVAVKKGKQDVNLFDRQTKELRAKLTEKSTQLQEAALENQVLHMAMNELQSELQVLFQKLRSSLPAHVNLEEFDLEALMSRMEKLARQGGGAYMRLYHNSRVKEAMQGTKQQPLDRAGDGSHGAPSPDAMSNMFSKPPSRADIMSCVSPSSPLSPLGSRRRSSKGCQSGGGPTPSQTLSAWESDLVSPKRVPERRISMSVNNIDSVLSRQGIFAEDSSDDDGQGLRPPMGKIVTASVTSIGNIRRVQRPPPSGNGRRRVASTDDTLDATQVVKPAPLPVKPDPVTPRTPNSTTALPPVNLKASGTPSGNKDPSAWKNKRPGRLNQID